MTVFTNRIRTAYLRKRQKRDRILAALLLIGVVAACGIAGRMDETRGAGYLRGQELDKCPRRFLTNALRGHREGGYQ